MVDKWNMEKSLEVQINELADEIKQVKEKLDLHGRMLEKISTDLDNVVVNLNREIPDICARLSKIEGC
jgi:septal ring factor EnvC (AmiA/AmiB activator)